MPDTDESLHPGEDTERERHDPDPTEHPIQPPGQATSPASDEQAKDHQRTGNPDEDAKNLGSANPVDEEDLQSVSWRLPRGVVERVKSFQEAHSLPNQSAAASAILAQSVTISEPAGGSDMPPAIAPGLTTSGVHRNY